MTYTIENHIINWYDNLSKTNKNKICNKYLGFKPVSKEKELLLKNYQKKELYNRHILKLEPNQLINL